MGAIVMIEFKNVYGHIEVYRDGVFLFSSDTIDEAEDELRKMNQESD